MSAASLARANAASAARAAERNRALAAEALYRLRDRACPPSWGDLARARIDCRDATWADIGAVLGQSKNQVTSKWRRLLDAAGLLEGGGRDGA